MIGARPTPTAPRAPSPSPTADRERVILLECRLEQLRSQLDLARAEADHARSGLAEAAAREAEHARGSSLLHDELAHARAEVAALHRRLDHSEALRAGLEGHLFEAGIRDDVEELVRLRRELLVERERARMNEPALARLRARVEELLASRETLFTRVAEWTQLVREGDPGAAELSKYLAELRREVLDLEHRGSAGEGREAALRERLAEAGVAADAPPVAAGPSLPEASATDALMAALARADLPAVRAELLRRAGRTDRQELLDAVSPATRAADPAVRAAGYEALSRLLDDDPSLLEAHLRAGLADADARVRRRAVLAAATARGLALRSLLGPLRDDPDPQVHRVVREALRHAPAGSAEPAAPETVA